MATKWGKGGSRYKFPGPGGLEGGPEPDYFAYDFVFRSTIISLTECNTGTTPKSEICS